MKRLRSYSIVPGVAESYSLEQFNCEAPENKILLIPARPTDWDVKFKIYATCKTLIECEVQKGKIFKLEITLRSKGRDLIIPPNFRKLN